MSNHRHGDVARELVQQARDDLLGHDVNVDGAATNLLIDAVEHDLIEQADHPTRDEARLAVLETQNRVLADAVMVITEAVHEAQPVALALRVQMLDGHDDPERLPLRAKDDGTVQILLIDDHDSFRKMACRMLVTAGYDVREAANGEIGLADYRQQRSDLVITDIVMPHMEGLETIVKLRRDDPDVKIIAISGADAQDGAYLESAVVFGARRSLRKPFTLDELLTAVTEVLAT